MRPRMTQDNFLSSIFLIIQIISEVPAQIFLTILKAALSCGACFVSFMLYRMII